MVPASNGPRWLALTASAASTGGVEGMPAGATR